MKRHIPGLATASERSDEPVDGFYMVRVVNARYRWDRQKPFYILRFEIEEPAVFKPQIITARLYCTVKALWKLNWFLRDFRYDPELLGRDELDERALCGLRGIVKISHTTVHGQRFLNLDAFATSDQWGEWYAPHAPGVEVA